MSDRSSDNTGTVTVVATGAIILVRGGTSRASILEDDAVAIVTTGAIVLVGGNGGRKNNAVEGIHIESVVFVACSLLMQTGGIDWTYRVLYHRFFHDVCDLVCC